MPDITLMADFCELWRFRAVHSHKMAVRARQPVGVARL